jgi:hypothetical protein
MLRGLNGIMYKEMLQLTRDPATIVMTILMPLIQLTLYGYAIDTEVRNVTTVVMDEDKTTASRDFVNRLAATGLYTIVGSTDSPEGMYQDILADRAKVGIHIPHGYERDLHNGRGAKVQVLIDGSNNTIASQTLGTVQNVGFAINSELLLLRNPSGPGPPLEVRPRLLFNPSLRSANFFVPGLMGILLSMVTTQLTALGIVREREVGTLEQLMVTPISKGALMLGKIVPYVALGMVQMMVVVFFAQALFKVPIHGNLGAGLRVQLAGPGADHQHHRQDPAAGDDDELPVHHAVDHAFGLHLPAREHAGADPVDQRAAAGDLLHRDPAQHRDPRRRLGRLLEPDADHRGDGRGRAGDCHGAFPQEPGVSSPRFRRACS